MDDEKKTGFDQFSEKENDTQTSSAAQRARNRTVMLTPDITGEVRARLAQDLQKDLQQDIDSEDEYDDYEDAPVFSKAPSEPADDNNGYKPFQSAAAAVESQVPPSYNEPVPTRPQYIPPQPSTQGSVISAPQAAPTPVSSATGDRVIWTKKGKIIGFLVSFDRDENGEVFELRSGRLIVTSEVSSSGNFLVIGDTTVSPMHAILRISATGEIQVLDQLSEHGTRISRFGNDDEIELSGDKGSLEHGDVIFFGERKFNVCILMVDGDE